MFDSVAIAAPPLCPSAVTSLAPVLTTGDSFPLLPVVLAFALAAVHYFASKLPGIDELPRSSVLSISSGVSVAYVFVHVLPEVGRTNRTVTETGLVLSHLDEYVYLVALLGFVTYYGLERYVRRTRPTPDGRTTRPGIFWIHVAAFAVYNALVGVLLFHRETPGVGRPLLFAFAMALHFVVNDYSLREEYEAAYCGRGRWVLTASVLVGAAIGVLVPVGRPLLGMLFAFLAGGIVLNVIKEELPEERDSRFVPFLVGSLGYSTLLLLA
jgi:zinc transporter ZupT